MWGVWVVLFYQFLCSRLVRMFSSVCLGNCFLSYRQHHLLMVILISNSRHLFIITFHGSPSYLSSRYLLCWLDPNSRKHFIEHITYFFWYGIPSIRVLFKFTSRSYSCCVRSFKQISKSYLVFTTYTASWQFLLHKQLFASICFPVNSIHLYNLFAFACLNNWSFVLTLMRPLGSGLYYFRALAVEWRPMLLV
jgi:hypothetical protein